ncbi:MAG: HNH endonuclease [Proteobacteria bacterium]|nr:HNH endonuclease [Pseudomonadota bacterium]
MQGGATPRTLLLSQSYEPIKVISWRRAFTLLMLGKIEVLEEYDRDVRTVNLVFKIPAVVRLLRAFRRHRKPVKFSRVNIYARDNYRCQYCGIKAPISDLTYDHVIPRSHGGMTTWTNIVTCCYECNRRKGNRTPDRAMMKLRCKPAQPHWVPAVSIRISMISMPEAWRDYLYWTGQLTIDGAEGPA